MNSLDTEFMKQKEVDASEWTTRETVEKDTEDENKKCGEILIGYNGAFTFVCVLCMKSFTTLDSFGLHINSHHFDNFVDSDSAEWSPRRVDTRTLNISTIEQNNGHQLEIMPFTSSEHQRSPQIVEYEDNYEHDSDQTDKPRTEELNSGRSRQSPIAGEPNVANKKADQLTSRPVPNTQTMTCKYCDKNFIDIAAFGEHLSAHTGPNKFVCPFCSKTFKRRSNRENHILTHTGERPHKCSYCPKTFADRGNMKMHERTHLGIKKHSCAYCDKSFVTSSERKAHEMTHTGEKPHQCEECGKQYANATALNNHAKRHQNIRNHRCNMCSKAFFTTVALKDHTLVHTKERPHTCKVCGQDFPRRRALRTHMQLHSTEKKYVCPMCGKAFAQFAGLYSHKKSHV